MTSGPSYLFSAFRARSLLGTFVLAFLISLIGYIILVPEWSTAEDTMLADAALLAVFYALLALFLWIACLRYGLVKDFSLGSVPGRREITGYILLGIPLVGVAILGLYILYIPLWYVAPQFVIFMLTDEYPLIWSRNNPEIFLASLIHAVLLILVAPVVEETFFRGFLLNRWWEKYGPRKAAIFSSLMFALLHADVIGGFIFGLVLSLIYIKTKSLIGPIVAHASNNGTVLIITLFDAAEVGGDPYFSIEEFREGWWLAGIGAVVGVPWLWWFSKNLFRRDVEAAN